MSLVEKQEFWIKIIEFANYFYKHHCIKYNRYNLWHFSI